MNQHKVEICMTPLQYNVYANQQQTVVLVDVFRATSVFITAIYNGAKEVIPVIEIEKALTYKSKGYIVAGERDCVKLESFDIGNSPLEYTPQKIGGRSIAITTTNGTQALAVIPKNTIVVAGSWVNENVLFNYLSALKNDILFLCSGWKFATSIEDILFAGQMVQKLLKTKNFTYDTDSTAISCRLAEMAGDKVLPFILANSPRLNRFFDTLQDDLNYCITKDCAPVLPILNNGTFTL